MSALLEVEDLRVDFGESGVLQEVSFELHAGETLGLVGESGSGKSTLARAILRLQRVARGSVRYQGLDLLACDAGTLRAQRRDLQIVFQDPLASLDPRMTIGDAIAEPLSIYEPLSAAARQRRVGEMLERVGLTAAAAARYPHEFSGGECQRIGIARAMILQPRVLICDEAVSSLDVSVQGQIINLLLDLQRDSGVAILFISHNLAVVRHMSHRVLVIYAGRLVEIAACDALFASPIHPYTRALLDSVPQLNAAPSGAAAAWEYPAAALSNAGGCAYRNRCRYALHLCGTVPPLKEVRAGHWAACHRSHEALYPVSFTP
jgi:oligopeptide/dipeptide ABC transporter ATP-binding protein